jgi:excinuclease ABC subunit A
LSKIPPRGEERFGKGGRKIKMPKRKTTPQQAIRIKGASQNNLKNLDLEIPLNHFIVVTGVSGSGKSSLAFDTLYAEGQRRYIETFSPYARQFMERMDRPQVEAIENIPPAIAIDRKDPVRTSRSTVGTMTELTDYVKLLYARLGQLHCGKCGTPVIPETPRHVWEALKDSPRKSQVIITFPISLRAATYEQMRRELGAMGFTRLFLAGQIRSLEAWEPEKEDEELHIVADRLVLRPSERKRIMDSLEQAFHFGKGRLDLWIGPPIQPRHSEAGGPARHLAFSSRLECAKCGIFYNAPLPNLFSFNSPVGACETCRGFGRTIDIDLDLIIPNPALSLEEGAIRPFGGRDDYRMEFDDLMAFCRRKKIPTKAPFKRLKKSHQKAIIDGTSEYYGIRGLFEWLETKTYKMHVRVYLSRYRSYVICAECGGTRFKEEALLYRLEELHIGQIYAMSVDGATDFFKRLPIPSEDLASQMILDEVRSRLSYLREVGLGYLTLDRHISHWTDSPAPFREAKCSVWPSPQP